LVNWAHQAYTCARGMSTELRLTRQSPRAFLTKSYPTMKKHNPSIPIMLREAQGTSPKVYARYEFGQEKSQSLEGTTAPARRAAPPQSPSLGEPAVRCEGACGRN